MDDKSGDQAGQGKISTWDSSKNLIVTPAICGREISCWKVLPGTVFKKSNATDSTISSIYLDITTHDEDPKQTAPHNITPIEVLMEFSDKRDKHVVQRNLFCDR